jgi:nucleoside-diphosphate-sugar epimerase
LLEAASGRIRRFVYISSVGVFGNPGVTQIDESFPVHPRGGKAGYHQTKAEAERLVIDWKGGAGETLEVVVARPTITYGPGDRDGMLTRLTGLIAAGRFVQIGSGRSHLHLTYIDDLVRGLLLAGRHPAAAGQAYIIAGPRTVSSGELAKMIARSLGRSPEFPTIPEKPARWLAGGIENIFRLGAALGVPGLSGPPPVTNDKIDSFCLHRGFSSPKATRELGYQPSVDLPEGIALTLEWLSASGRLASHPVSAHPPSAPETNRSL